MSLNWKELETPSKLSRGNTHHGEETSFHQKQW
jgi:hypothetical protein